MEEMGDGNIWVLRLDVKSKRMISFMMMPFALADTGERDNLRLISIPAQ